MLAITMYMYIMLINAVFHGSVACTFVCNTKLLTTQNVSFPLLFISLSHLHTVAQCFIIDTAQCQRWPKEEMGSHISRSGREGRREGQREGNKGGEKKEGKIKCSDMDTVWL